MYFFDSYALVEIIKGNGSYDTYKSNSPKCLLINLFELHQVLLREFNKQTADYWVKKFNYIIIDIKKEDIIVASDFRHKHKDKKFSMVDCIGYIVAKRNKLKFLTGNKGFKNLENVEFVK